MIGLAFFSGCRDDVTENDSLATCSLSVSDCAQKVNGETTCSFANIPSPHNTCQFKCNDSNNPDDSCVLLPNSCTCSDSSGQTSTVRYAECDSDGNCQQPLPSIPDDQSMYTLATVDSCNNVKSSETCKKQTVYSESCYETAEKAMNRLNKWECEAINLSSESLSEFFICDAYVCDKSGVDLTSVTNCYGGPRVVGLTAPFVRFAFSDNCKYPADGTLLSGTGCTIDIGGTTTFAGTVYPGELAVICSVAYGILSNCWLVQRPSAASVIVTTNDHDLCTSTSYTRVSCDSNTVSFRHAKTTKQPRNRDSTN
jgi:hypothetical protein